MIDTEILDDYSSEARELLDEMDHSLMRLEKEGGVPELLNNVFRAVHCIKGSAQYIGLESSSTLTHGLENLLDRLREGVVRLEPRVMEFLFRAKDLIAALIDEVAQHREERSDISGMMAELEQLIQQTPEAASAEPPQTEAPPSAEAEPEVAEEGVPEAEQAAAAEQVAEIEAYPPGVTQELEAYSETPPEESGAFMDSGLDEEDDALYASLPYVVREYDEELAEADEFEEDLSEPSFGAIVEEEEEFLGTEETEATQVERGDEEPAEVPVAAAGDTLEATVPHLLTISLYLDDFQDGFFRPSEIVPQVLGVVETVRLSYAEMGMFEAASLLEAIENTLAAIDPEVDALPGEQVDELRSLLYELRAYYPESLFPLAERPAEAPGESDVLSAAMEAAAAEAETYLGVDRAAEEEPTEMVPETPFPFPGAGAPGPVEPAADQGPGVTVGVSGPTPAVAAPVGPSLWTPAPGPREHSMLADVDEELLKEFETGFTRGRAQAEVAAGSGALQFSSDLIEAQDVMGEGADREIIEIFMSYGLEILDKLRPLVAKIGEGEFGRDEVDLAAELIRSIRSSSTYMDYQKLASFLDEWYEDTLAASEQLATATPSTFAFMEDNSRKFQSFLGDLQLALSPDAVRPAPVPEAAFETRVPAARQAEIPAPPSAALGGVMARGTEVAEAVAQAQAAAARPVVGKAPEHVPPKSGVAPAAKPPVREPESVAAAAARTSERPTAAGEATSASAASEPMKYADPLLSREAGDGPLVKTMRVDASKVDTLLNQVGELVVNRSYVEQLSLDLKVFHRSLTSIGGVGKKEIQGIKDLALKVGEASIALGRVATDIQEGVMKLRMLPVGQLFNRMPRLIRDLSRRVGKTVNLEVHGADTEVDKRVIEQIYNPLVHLIRNAVDHGIESKEARKVAGKPEEGLIVLRAYSQGNLVSIDVEDDGAGIDTDAVLAKALENRLIEPQESANLSPQEVYNFLFIPGFSTSKSVTRTSGRGVGMDVVKKDVEKINGHIDIESWETVGTRISIKIPLTLAIIQTLLIRSLNHVFAIPLTSVREIVQISPHEITTIEGFEVIKFREETIPVLRINEIFNLKQTYSSKLPRFLVLATAGNRSMGFLVEELIGEQDVVIKPLAEHVFKNRGLAGSTILGDGTIALVLDVTELVEDIISQQRQASILGGTRYTSASSERG
ncbi:MAG: chemotaxis protein CheW [Desulfomonile tiedjei]|nr:chemotaxis protein CheW [Desulfomonile tiedjei]